MEDLNRIIYLVLGDITYIYVNGKMVDTYDEANENGDRLDKALPHITDINKEIRVQEVNHEFDCTGLVYWCHQQAGANLPARVTTAFETLSKQYHVGEIDSVKLQPGDVLISQSHAGIYIGDDTYIHAPQTGETVKKSSLTTRQNGSNKFTDVYRFY